MLTLVLEPPFALCHQPTSLGVKRLPKAPKSLSVPRPGNAVSENTQKMRDAATPGPQAWSGTRLLQASKPLSPAAGAEACWGYACQEDTAWLQPHGKWPLPLGKASETVD